jgi:hypothetical protein
MIFLITRPEHDPATTTLSEYSIAIINFARERGHNTINCHCQNVTKASVHEIIKKKKPNFIMFNGHGNDDLICGQEYEPIIRMEDIELIKDKIIYARTCNTAIQMGKKCGEEGTGAFIGFKNTFKIWNSSFFGFRPLEDPYAKLILEPTNNIAISLLKGCTVAEAISHGKEAYNKTIQALEQSSSAEGLRFLLSVLYWNREHLCAQGNLELRL